MAKTGRIIAAIVVAVPAAGLAFDPFQFQNQQQRTLNDPENLGRPTTEAFKGADIKQHRDKLNAVKAQVFKEGGPPAGATFRAAVQDGKMVPNTYVAEATFGDFTPDVQAQIAEKSGGQAPPANQRVAVVVDVGPDAVTVANARLSGAAPAVDTARLNSPGSLPSLPRTPNTSIPVPPAGNQPAAPTTAAQPKREEAPAARVDEPVRPDNRPATPPSRPSSITPAMPAVMSVRIAAVSLVGNRAAVPAPNAVDIEPTAVIPAKGGAEIFVRATDPSPAGMTRIAVSGRVAALPQALQARIGNDLGASALDRFGDAPITVVLEVKADRSMRVVEARAESKTAPLTPAPVRAPADAALSGPPALLPAVPPASADRAATAPAAAPAAPGKGPAAGTRVAERPFPALGAARAVAAWSGLDVSAVRLQAPRDARTASVSVPTREGRSIRVEVERAEQRSEPPVIRAEGRFSDFSPATRAQVMEALGAFNAAPMVEARTDVAIEARPAEGDRMAVTEVAIRQSQAANAEPMVLWRAAEPVTAPEAVEAPADDAAPRPAADLPVKPAAATGQPAQPVAPQPGGLAPAVAALATEAYGMPENGFEVKPADTREPAVKIDPRGIRPPLTVNWRITDDGRHAFAANGAGVDFTDAIRDQVYEKLRDAVENGDTWASDAMKGRREVRVAFETDPANPGKVRVKDVTQTMDDAATMAAADMGLDPGDFFVVNLGQQGLVVLEQGKSATLRVGDRVLKLKSPDGDAKVFVIPGKQKKDTSAVLMLSRESMRANQSAIIRAAGPNGAAAVKAAMEGNPEAGEFIVNLDPNSEDKIAIRAMSAGASLNGPALDVKKRPGPDL